MQRDTGLPYFEGLALGLLAGTVCAVLAAIVFGAAMLGIRGHYFAIGTLGLGIAAGEVAAGWDYVGAGSGMRRSILASSDNARSSSAIRSLRWRRFCFLVLRWLYRGTRFGLALNAIRDDHDKADAMGLRTTPIKIFAWALSAFSSQSPAAACRNMIGSSDPRDVALQTRLWRLDGADGQFSAQNALGPVLTRVRLPCHAGALLDLTCSAGSALRSGFSSSSSSSSFRKHHGLARRAPRADGGGLMSVLLDVQNVTKRRRRRCE